jgi:hypothetical protein
MDVLKVGKWAGKWIVAGFVNGAGFSTVFTKTGQLWKDLELAVEILGSASRTLSVTSRGWQLPRRGGDIDTEFGIRDQRRLDLNRYGNAIDAIKKDWHPIDHDLKSFYGLPEGGKINWSTGQVIANRTSIDLTDGPETWIPMFFSGGLELKLTAKLGSEVLEEGAVKGVSVIGPRATYRQFAKNIGANFLDVTDEEWSWSLNRKFLAGIVKRGDDVIFAGKFDPMKLDSKSVLAREMNYLSKHGYKWNVDFTKMVLKK